MTYRKTKFECPGDGLTIRGTEYRPEGEKLPVAIISHGFMANSKTVRQYAELFAERGYAAFIFDFCGGCVIGGKSDGSTRQMSVLTEVRDLKAVIRYAASLPYTDAEDITLMGCSQGGFVSALTAAELKERIKKLVLFYPALCIPDDARAGRMMFARFDPKSPPEAFRCGPMKLGRQYITDVVEMDPYELIVPYGGDVLIVHGTKDGIVNVRYSEQAARAYAERTEGSVKLHTIQGGRHMFGRRHDRIAMKYLSDFI